MARMEQMEWHQTRKGCVYVFDTLPLIPLQPLPLAHSLQLRCHQPPLLRILAGEHTSLFMHTTPDERRPMF